MSIVKRYLEELEEYNETEQADELQAFETMLDELLLANSILETADPLPD